MINLSTIDKKCWITVLKDYNLVITVVLGLIFFIGISNVKGNFGKSLILLSIFMEAIYLIILNYENLEILQKRIKQ